VIEPSDEHKELENTHERQKKIKMAVEISDPDGGFFTCGEPVAWVFADAAVPDSHHQSDADEDAGHFQYRCVND
jgi:hypothetical protein